MTLYNLCVKYENDSTPYMIGFTKKGSEGIFYNLNLELIDSFTSIYSSKQMLLDRIGKSVSSKRKPIDVFILYSQAQKGKDYGEEYESIPTVRKLDVIVNDQNIYEICKKFVDDKYVNKTNKKMDKTDETIKQVFNKMKHMVETENGYNRIDADPVLSQYAAKFKEKLLAYGTYYMEAKDKEKSNVYSVALSYLLANYATFRHVYIHLLRPDLKDALIYSTKPAEIKKHKNIKNEESIVTNVEVEKKIAFEDRIEDTFLRAKYIETDGDAENIYIYCGEDYCNNLSDNDKKIVFGDYDVFKERMKNEYPDLSRSRGF